MHRMITATHSGHFPIADATVTANAVIAKITNTVSILFLLYGLVSVCVVTVLSATPVVSGKLEPSVVVVVELLVSVVIV
jgi:hypothetical protein